MQCLCRETESKCLEEEEGVGVVDGHVVSQAFMQDIRVCIPSLITTFPPNINQVFSWKILAFYNMQLSWKPNVNCAARLLEHPCVHPRVCAQKKKLEPAHKNTAP